MIEQQHEPKSETKSDQKKIAIAGAGLAGILINFVVLYSIKSTKVKKNTETKQQTKQKVASTSRKKITDNAGYEGQKSTY